MWQLTEPEVSTPEATGVAKSCAILKRRSFRLVVATRSFLPGGVKKNYLGNVSFREFGQSRCRLRTYRIGNGENSLSGVFIVAGGQWKKEILLLFKKKRNSAWILNPLKKSAAGPLWSTD
jgi:hypothetical protein